MSSAIRAVVFDVGGVLEKVEPAEVLLRRTADRLGTPAATIDAALRSLGGGERSTVGQLSEDEFRAGVAAALGLTDGQADAFMQEVWDWYCGQLDHDLIAFVRQLRATCATAILSNSSDGARREEEQRYGFSEVFDPIIYSHEVGLAKPNPRIYALTCERLGVAPHEAIFLDDIQLCVDAANHSGMWGVLHRTTPESIRVISDLLRDSSGADPYRGHSPPSAGD